MTHIPFTECCSTVDTSRSNQSFESKDDNEKDGNAVLSKKLKQFHGEIDLLPKGKVQYKYQ